ncbi:hypothetical protein SAMN06296386_102337 [Lachnospiraceae bacterium]|nr:hypothetical protein SAMN06296386_102337 [Lachnospiraceae bacterium]
MKKLGKFITFALLAGAAAAGTYYLLKDIKDEDSFEDSDRDVNDDLEEFLKNEAEAKDISPAAKREYVPLNFSKETTDIAPAEDKIIGETEKSSENNVEKDPASDKVSTFRFSSFDEADED